MSFLLALAVSMTGCATSGYLTDRARDAGDIFTATVGVGVGAKARVGPITPALILHENFAGIQGGDLFCKDDEWGSFKYGADAILWYGGDWGNHSELAKKRNKDHDAFVCLFIARPTALCVQPRYNPSYFTQIEAVLALGPSIRLGVNPGELIDFLLGWTSLDIFGDDLEARNKNKEKSTQGVEATE